MKPTIRIALLSLMICLAGGSPKVGTTLGASGVPVSVVTWGDRTVDVAALTWGSFA